MIESTQVKWARRVAGIAAKLNAPQKMFAEKSESKRPRERPKSRWGNDINTYLKEAAYGITDLNDVV